MDFLGVRSKLLSENEETRLKSLNELRERLDVVQTAEFPNFLSNLFPVFQTLLRRQISPQFQRNFANKSRNIILEILNRLPNTDALLPFVSDLLQLAFHVFCVDNEENGVIGLRILFDLHKNYRPALLKEVAPFLEQVQKMYTNLHHMITKTFTSPPSQQQVAAGSGTATTAEVAAKKQQLKPSFESFKVLSECPVVVMLQFQCYASLIETNIPMLVPLMMSSLSLKCPENARVEHYNSYMQYLACQVKTLSFVTFLLRGFSELMRPYQGTICELIVKFFVLCPMEEGVNIRKDLLIASRHILTTDFRRGFFPHFEELLDDNVLVGKERSSYYQLRPLAYSTLADLVHHVRDLLSLQQVSKVVGFFGKTIHDPTLPICIQTTSIRLLLNLVDFSFNNNDTDPWKGRNILSRILLTIVSKFSTLLKYIPVVVASCEEQEKERSGNAFETSALAQIQSSSALLPSQPVVLTEADKKLKQLLSPYVVKHDSFVGLPEEENTVRDVKALLKTMILGIRTVIWCAANYRNPAASKNNDSSNENNPSNSSLFTTKSNNQFVSTSKSKLAANTDSNKGGKSGESSASVYPLTNDERKLINSFCQNGLRCFVIYTLAACTITEEKEVLDHFAGAFTVLDAVDFRDLFLHNIQLLYECILQDHAILTIPQHFLANKNVSSWFAEILLKFLITQMKDLSAEPLYETADMAINDKIIALTSLQLENMRPIAKKHRASVILRLFKIVFGSVTLYDSNESVLQPRLREIVSTCLKEATLTKTPENYYYLLRALFRSISGGKYPLFYNELLPILPDLLSALIRLQTHTTDPVLQDVLLELFLTIPARLSTLLQYLPILMRSVVKAICSKGELVNLGLRTLEFWVLNLNPDFLQSVMSSQNRLLTEVITALTTHLHPPPYPYGALAMRLLGKLGGRNRRYLNDSLSLEYKNSNGVDGIVIDFVWVEKKSKAVVSLSMDGYIEQVSNLLQDFCKHVSPRSRHHPRSLMSSSKQQQQQQQQHKKVKPKEEKKPNDDVNTSFERILHSSEQIITSSVLHQKRQALKFLSKVLILALGLREQSVDVMKIKRQWQSDGDYKDDTVDDVSHDLKAQFSASVSYADPLLNLEKLKAQKDSLTRLYCALFTAAALDEELREDALVLLKGVAVHVTLILLSRCRRGPPKPHLLTKLSSSTIAASPRGLAKPKLVGTMTERFLLIQEAFFGKADIIEEGNIGESGSWLNFLFHQVVLSHLLSSVEEEKIALGKQMLTVIVDTTLSMCSDDDNAELAAVKNAGGMFNKLADLFTHACHEKQKGWSHKVAGMRGIKILSELLHARFIQENQLSLVRSLLFVLSDHPSEKSINLVEETGETLLNLLRKCHTLPFTGDHDVQHTELIQIFVMELVSSKSCVRKYVKQSLDLVAKAQQTDIVELLSPYQSEITKQIFSTSLRQIPLASRIGYIDAMEFGLSLPNKPLFPMSKELITFLQEAWAITSSEDLSPSQQPTSSSSSSTTESSNNSTENSHTNSSTSGANLTSTMRLKTCGSILPEDIPLTGLTYPFDLSLSCRLRIYSIALLRSTFLAYPEQINKEVEARNCFVNLFFKSLINQPEEVVSAAQRALSDVIQLFKQIKERALPKDLLQQCLRPVLLNLADYRKLTLPLLDGLSRLLSLLSSCFNVTLGEKLLEHLKQWREPERIIAAGIWKKGEEPKVAAAIIDLFHLLPPSESFLEPLISCVLELEEILPRYGSFGHISSPYRLPLTKFLNRYAHHTVTFFLKKLTDLKRASLFQYIVKLPEAQPIRNVLIGENGGQAIITATFVAASKAVGNNSASTATNTATTSSTVSTTNAPTAAQIQVNAQKAQAVAVANATAQGLTGPQAENQGKQAQAAYLAKAQTQVNVQNAAKAQSQAQLQVNAQRVHSRALATAQAQGLSLAQAQLKAQKASNDFVTSQQSTSYTSSVTNSPSAQQLHAQIQLNSQKVHAQALSAAQSAGLKPIAAAERAKQAQAAYIQRAQAQAQAKMVARMNSTCSSNTSTNPTPSSTMHTALELHYQGLRLIRSLAKLEPMWLGKEKLMIDCLRKLWHSASRLQRLKNQDRLQIRYHTESKLLVKCLIIYCRQNPTDVQVLFDMLRVFLQRTSVDFSFLRRFFREEVATKYTPPQRRAIIRYFLKLLRTTESEELKVHALQLLILPLLCGTFDDPNLANEDVLDDDTIALLMKEVLSTKLQDASSSAKQSNLKALRIELLQLGTLLIQHMSTAFVEHRKELIKFAWNHLKSEDSTSKLWAYVNVCRFISVYNTPPKIILQVYVALLRTYQPESRSLVKKALGILLPALPQRLPPNEFIKAIKWTKKVIYEEGHALPQLVHVYILIRRQPALFYSYRSQFVPQMVNTLNRLALSLTSTLENRRLAVSLVDLIVAWEITRRERLSDKNEVSSASSSSISTSSSTSKKRSSNEIETITIASQKKMKVEAGAANLLKREEPVSGSTTTEAASTPPSDPLLLASSNEEGFELNESMVEVIVNFLLRIALSPADSKENTILAERCVKLFDQSLHLWPEATVRFAYFDKLVMKTLLSLTNADSSKDATNTLTTPPGNPNTVKHPANSSTAATNSNPLAALKGSSTRLSACLDMLNNMLSILNTLISIPVPKKVNKLPFVLENAEKIQKLLAPCFEQLHDELQDKLVAYLTTMFRLYPPTETESLVDSQFVSWLKQMILTRLANATLAQKELSNLSNLTSSSSSATAKGLSAETIKIKQFLTANQSSQINNSKTANSSIFPGSELVRSPGHYASQMLLSIAKYNVSFVDQFISPILKLAQRLARDHLQYVCSIENSKPPTLEGSTGGAEVGVSPGERGKDRVMATPTLAMLGEWQKLRNGVSKLIHSSSFTSSSNATSTSSTASKTKKSSEPSLKKSTSTSTTGSTGSNSPNVTKKNMTATQKKKTKQHIVSTMDGVVRNASCLTLIALLRILSKCSFSCVDHRRVFLNCMQQCLDRSTHIPLLLEITHIVTLLSRHDENSSNKQLSPKEKMNFLSKMTVFDRLDEITAQPLIQAHQEYILNLCREQPDLLETNNHIRGPFMIGLMSPQHQIRQRFFELLMKQQSNETSKLIFCLGLDWSSCGTRFWPVVAVEILMTAISQSVSPIFNPGNMMSPLITTGLDKQSRLPTGIRSCLSSYVRFCETIGNTVSVSDLLFPLRDLAHINLSISKDLWSCFFNQAFLSASSQGEEEIELITSCFLSLLAQRYHRRELQVPSASTDSSINNIAGCRNVVQTLMHGLQKQYDEVNLPAELLFFLAKTYDVWHYVVPIVEFQALNPEITKEERERWVETLYHIYKSLNEKDLQIGLSHRFTTQPETKHALLLESHGYIGEAQDTYFKILTKAQQASRTSSVISPSSSTPISSSNIFDGGVTRFELNVWEDGWVECGRQLCQWSLLSDFAKSTQSHELLLECAWKKGEWSLASKLLLTPSIQALTEAGCPEIRLTKLYIACQQQNRPLIDKLVSQTIHLALHQWQGLPRILTYAHAPLLHLFHKFAEIQESVIMSAEIQRTSSARTLPNFKTSINTWRERLPNKWENILLWDEILTWRTHMFEVVKKSFTWSEAQMLACLHDGPWSMIKLAHVARKQTLPEVCLSALAKLYSVTSMDVQDAFTKLREQVIVCLDTQTSLTDYYGGLSILNNTNLDYFNVRQKAELFRLKGMFLNALGNANEANQSFSHCLQICDNYGKAWLTWGKYCDGLFKQHLSKKGSQGKFQIDFAIQAMACYLQAVHHRCSSARLMLARVIWLLSMDDKKGSLAHAFEAHGKQLPIWIWIIWIPQLLMALCRPEAPQVRGLLRGLAAKFPQALYYTMRAFLLEKRETPTNIHGTKTEGISVAPPSSSGKNNTATENNIYFRTKSGHVVSVPSNMPASKIQEIPGVVGAPRASPLQFGVASTTSVFTLEKWKEKVTSVEGGEAGMKASISPVTYTEDLMGFLRRSHDSLAMEMECMLEEIIIRFRPEPEEELLSAVHALLVKCCQLPSIALQEPTPVSLKDTLNRVGQKFFQLNTPQSIPNSSSLPPLKSSEKHVQFVRRYKASFERDFCFKTETTPAASPNTRHSKRLKSSQSEEDSINSPGLHEIIDRLKLWKHVLQIHVKKGGRPSGFAMDLEKCSRHLIEFSSATLEIPGQYITDSEPITDLHVRLQHFHNKVTMLHRPGYTQRRISLGGDNGRDFCFLVQFQVPHFTRTDERMMQLHILMNRLLDRYKETKKRNTQFHVPVVIPITPRVRLLGDHQAFVSLGEIYELNCLSKQKDVDLPVTLFRQKIGKVQGKFFKVAPSTDSQRLEVIQSIIQAKTELFNEICTQHISEHLLSKYMHQVLHHCDDMFAFRSEFAKHLALTSFLCYAFCVGDRTPHKVVFSKETARVVSCDVRPGYSVNGLLEPNEVVPFRLTRNLQCFMTQFGVDGVFANTMSAVADAIMSKSDIVESQLNLFFRDDLLSWHASKLRSSSRSGGADVDQSTLDVQVQPRVHTNVQKVLERTQNIAPSKHGASCSSSGSIGSVNVAMEAATNTGSANANVANTFRGQKVYELIAIATSSKKQCQMPPTWFPWL